MRLLPRNAELGWTPYAWLIYTVPMLLALFRASLDPGSLAAYLTACNSPDIGDLLRLLKEDMLYVSDAGGKVPAWMVMAVPGVAAAAAALMVGNGLAWLPLAPLALAPACTCIRHTTKGLVCRRSRRWHAAHLRSLATSAACPRW